MMKRLLSLLCLMGIMFAFQARLYGMDVSFQLVVVNGTADKVGMMVQAYQTVTITANSYADKVFSQWVCNDNVELADATAAQTTFIMPLFPVTVIAMYKPTVTVVDGVADKAAAAEGETVTITADEPAEDEEFDKWVGDGVEFENANDVQTSFVMPAAAVTVRATYRNKTVAPLYMVVYDLDKTEWKIRYTNYGPDLSKDACRTTELWLRYIPAGKFTMGSPADEKDRFDNETQHEVTLTRPFFIGVFECTQKQWELVMGNRPSYFNNDDYYATRPVEQVSYDTIRSADWPSSDYTVGDTSFMGILRAGTGLTFDLPTEAQWEYACRAGTTTALNSGEDLASVDQDAAMDDVGRYYYNGGKNSLNDQDCDTTKGTAKAGSYRPNNWGLYDMHGNVFEWCLDRWNGSTPYSASSVEDPKGDESAYYRVIRGGSWHDVALICRSALRDSVFPSGRLKSTGFRVLCLIPPETYAVTVVDGTADKTTAAEGETVTITADEPAEDEEFDKWVGDGVEFEDANAVQTSFVMPANAVTVTATFKKLPAMKTYKIVVVNGTADKAKAAVGETVTLTAKPAPAGKVFDKWTGRGVAFENAAAPVTTFEMPANNVTVTATFKKLPSVKTYKIVVVNGKADKAKAVAGETVTLTANPPPVGKVFDRWTGGAAFDDPNAAETTFVMPAKAVTPKALYKRK